MDSAVGGIESPLPEPHLLLSPLSLFILTNYSETFAEIPPRDYFLSLISVRNVIEPGFLILYRHLKPLPGHRGLDQWLTNIDISSPSCCLSAAGL